MIGNHGGRKPEPRRAGFVRKFGSTHAYPRHRMLPIALMDQLDRCADDEARRIILKAISPKWERDQRAERILS